MNNRIKLGLRLLLITLLSSFLLACDGETTDENPAEITSPDSESELSLDDQLAEAIDGDDLAEATRLLEAGADPNTMMGDDFFFNPVLRTAVLNENLDMVNLLLENGADPNGKDNKDDEILWRAVTSGNIAISEALISAGANVNSISSQGNAPIALAANTKNVELVNLLLENGADPNGGMEISTITTVAVASCAYLEPALNVAAFHNEPEIATTLLDAGADIQARSAGSTQCSLGEDDLGRTALDVAAGVNSTEVAALLLDRGADITQGYNFGPPIVSAASFGSIETLELLIERGADPDIEWNGIVTNLTESQINEVQAILDAAMGE